MVYNVASTPIFTQNRPPAWCVAQVGSKIKKWEINLNNNGPRNQKEPFLASKNGGEKEKKNIGALIL